VRDVPGGVAVLDPRFPESREDNRLLLSDPVDAASVQRTATSGAADARGPARAATLRWPGAAVVAGELAGRGWRAEELVVMVRPAGPLPGGQRAEVVDRSAGRPLRSRAWRAALAGTGRARDDVIAQLVGREEDDDRVLAVTDVAVREEGEVVAAGRLRVDGGTAAVDSVVTDPAARGRGHGRAVLARLLTLAAEAGCDLVVLEADADDWPRHWYTRAGFAVVGSVWDVVAGPAPAQTGANTVSSR
jgi:ribosomal protein S18 acetylase RimI-like enzyme